MKGSCLCGAVCYEIDQLDTPVIHCHCHTCRKAHAAPFTSVARVMRAHFHWQAGEAQLGSYESSPGKRRHFCANCGTQLISERADDPYIILRVATLDEDPGARPAMHIWCSEAAPWLQDAEDTPHYDAWPPGRS